jgi:hypothetical protein
MCAANGPHLERNRIEMPLLHEIEVNPHVRLDVDFALSFVLLAVKRGSGAGKTLKIEAAQVVIHRRYDHGRSQKFL